MITLYICASYLQIKHVSTSCKTIHFQASDGFFTPTTSFTAEETSAKHLKWTDQRPKPSSQLKSDVTRDDRYCGQSGEAKCLATFCLTSGVVLVQTNKQGRWRRSCKHSYKQKHIQDNTATVLCRFGFRGSLLLSEVSKFI